MAPPTGEFRPHMLIFGARAGHESWPHRLRAARLQPAARGMSGWGQDLSAQHRSIRGWGHRSPVGGAGSHPQSHPGAEHFAEPCQPRPVGCHLHPRDLDAALGVRRVGHDRREPAAVLDRSERTGRAAGGGVGGQRERAVSGADPAVSCLYATRWHAARGLVHRVGTTCPRAEALIAQRAEVGHLRASWSVKRKLRSRSSALGASVNTGALPCLLRTVIAAGCVDHGVPLGWSGL
jgi:hypothetical protein